MYSFFKEETFGSRQQLTFIGDELKIYLPKNYLEADSVFANKLGNVIETLGLFWFSVGNKFYELSLPVKIQFEYQETDSFSGKLIPSLPAIDYDVFILNRGDAFCKDLLHIEGIGDLETMLLRIIDQGKLPANMSYDEAPSIMYNLFIAAGVKGKLGVTSTIIEILFSEMYRNKHNMSEPFRKLLANNKNASMYDFKLVRVSRLSGFNSVFNSFIGEDTYQQLANAVVRTKEHATDRDTPMERLLKY